MLNQPISPLCCQLMRVQIARVIKRNISFKYKRPEKITACDKALKHFDDYYKSLYKKKWSSIRLGLLSSEKKVAVLNNFANVEEHKEVLEAQGAYNMRSFLEHHKNYIDKEKKISTPSKKQNNPLKEVIEQKVQATEEAEWNEIYSPDKNISVKANLYESSETDENVETPEKESYVYDPEDATTSLRADVLKAVIDKTRIILPDSESTSLLYDFVPTTKLRGLEEYISEAEYYKYYKEKEENQIEIQLEHNLNFPDSLNVYTFDRGDVSEFESPTRCLNNIFNYILMNGADLLTVLVLDVQPGETFIDLMSSSAAQAFCVLQTLKPKMVIGANNSNFVKFFENHLYDYSTDWKGILSLTSLNWKKDEFTNLYDKILLDVCCTDDRTSLSQPENNYFSAINKVNRLKLPSVQTALLIKALKCVEKGGAVVYTTKTLCPVQNDGVVSEALKVVLNNTKMKFCVKDLSPALEHTTLLFRYENFVNLKYGKLILPFLPSNFGPRFIAKIVRLE